MDIVKKESAAATPSKAAIFGHPLHPALIPFPIAFLTGALLTDLIFWRTGQRFWANVSFVLVAGGLIGGGLAALMGRIDFLGFRQARRTVGWLHFLGNVAVLAPSAVNLLPRRGNPAGAVIPWGLGISLVTAGLLTITGWLGGELVFRHKIGVVGTGRGGEAQ